MSGTVLIALHILSHLILSATACHSNRKLEEFLSNRASTEQDASHQEESAKGAIRNAFY